MHTRTFRLTALVASLLATSLCWMTSSCKKCEDPQGTGTTTPNCNWNFDTLVNGRCELKPNFVRWGEYVLLSKDWGNVWITTTSCPCLDSTAIVLNTDTVQGQPYRTSLLTEHHAGIREAPQFGNGVVFTGAQPRTYFPDPVLGDSVVITLLTRCGAFDYLAATPVPGSKSAAFFGRKNLAGDTMRGFVRYIDDQGNLTAERCDGVKWWLLK